MVLARSHSIVLVYTHKFNTNSKIVILFPVEMGLRVPFFFLRKPQEVNITLDILRLRNQSNRTKSTIHLRGTY